MTAKKPATKTTAPKKEDVPEGFTPEEGLAARNETMTPDSRRNAPGQTKTASKAKNG